ncbi:MAG: hypothetical protein MUE73_04925 [Planctomycetes bacterium]|jgi:hypothetical protein|nr:hypothetical protein [Planctomycetota bacterium]
MATPTEKLSLSEFVTRRLNPVKVTIQLLKHELDRNSEGGTTRVNSPLVGSVINTLELFVEDYEKLIEKTSPGPKAGGERTFVGGDSPKV